MTLSLLKEQVLTIFVISPSPMTDRRLHICHRHNCYDRFPLLVSILQHFLSDLFSLPPSSDMPHNDKIATRKLLVKWPEINQFQILLRTGQLRRQKKPFLTVCIP